MEIEIENPLEFIIETSYLKGILAGKETKLAELKNLNELIDKIYNKIKEGLENEK